MAEVNLYVEPGEGRVPEIVILEGKAPDTWREPIKVNLQGNIFAPGEFVTKRENEVAALKQKTHVIFDYDNLSIQLVVDEENHYQQKVIGKLTLFPEFESLGINRQKNYTVRDLYKVLRFQRAFFQSREDHAAILDQLKKFQAKTEIEFQNINDFKGSTALSKIQTCKTNLSYNFNLNIPIYKGTDALTFQVEIEFEPNDGSIVCWLVSEDVAELEVKVRDEIMDKELEKFKDFVVIKK
jgi:hypothetical protein